MVILCMVALFKKNFNIFIVLYFLNDWTNDKRRLSFTIGRVVFLLMALIKANTSFALMLIRNQLVEELCI